MLPRLVCGESALEQWAVFKWRLVSMFHIASSLRHVTATRQAMDTLRPEVSRALVELRRRVRFVHAFKTIRDALVHYDVDGASGATKEDFSPLERRANRPLRQLRVETEGALFDVSHVLSELMPPRGDVRRPV